MREWVWGTPRSRSREQCAPRGAHGHPRPGRQGGRGSGGGIPGLGLQPNLSHPRALSPRPPWPYQASQWPSGVSRTRGKKVRRILWFPEVTCHGTGGCILTSSHITPTPVFLLPKSFQRGRAGLRMAQPSRWDFSGGVCLTSQRPAGWWGQGRAPHQTRRASPGDGHR